MPVGGRDVSGGAYLWGAAAHAMFQVSPWAPVNQTRNAADLVCAD